MPQDITKTILFLINGLGVASKDSFDIKFSEVMPNLSMLMSNYLYANLENVNYNYKNGYRNFSLGNDLLPTYHKLENDTNLMQNQTILSIANDAMVNHTKLHIFCFLDNNQVIQQVLKIIDVLRLKGDFPIFIHLILRQKNILEYDLILSMLKNVEEKITLYQNVEIGIVAGERTMNKEEYSHLFCKEMGEKWPDYMRKMNYAKNKGIVPRELDPFYIHTGFKKQDYDISLFFNYEDVDCTEFIRKNRNIKLYTLFPMKAFSYAIHLYDELEPLDFFSKKLQTHHLKCLILTKEDRISSIRYSLNGLKDVEQDQIEFMDISKKDLDMEKLFSSNHHLVIFDYDLESFQEIKRMKDFLMYLDDQIDQIYNICDQNNYNMFISSLYGVYHDDYIAGVDKKVKLDYSQEVPVVMIDRKYSKAKYFLKYGTTYHLSNTILQSMTHDENMKTLVRKKGILSFFKD